MTTSKKINCVFRFPGSTCQAMAHLFEHEYGNRVFWYGVAQLGEPLTELLESFRIDFEDGRSGLATHYGGSLSGDYKELPFVGVTALHERQQV